ncbi:putative beta,beta-carotene 9',10'-oxygenase [Apostichopus japonicus]|uniref:Putative beta,beta-carotene 9',10'-oxygenase n=1 Tax=Stichopus japonicus TaxID=307972 RepID=A0A2G8KA32_STIJA|nr:putative beta,beta-carotene 9',10'-oxygenase [Apostichopus japonicus]
MASPQAENEDGVNVNQQGPLSTAALFNSSHETPTAVEAKIIVKYNSRFIRSDAYVKATEQKRLVYSSFGQAYIPDPCKNIFSRFFSYFDLEPTDNCNVNFMQLGEDFYALTESPRVIKIEPDELDTIKQANLSSYMTVHTATAHPHYGKDGTVYGMGSTFGPGSSYNIIKFPPGESQNQLEMAKIFCKIPASSSLYPSYYHSFGMTENYIVFLEQPLTMNMFKIMFAKLLDVMEEAYLNRLRDETLSAGRAFAKRFVLPLEQIGNEDNLVTLESCDATAYLQEDESVHCHPEMLTDQYVELPRINYDAFNGKKYQYFYGLDTLDRTKVVKVDTVNKTFMSWNDPSCYPSEPVFIPRPGGEAEDDGVVLSSVIDLKGIGRRPYLVVLDAQSFTEWARAEIPAEVPVGLHGIFIPNHFMSKADVIRIPVYVNEGLINGLLHVRLSPVNIRTADVSQAMQEAQGRLRPGIGDRFRGILDLIRLLLTTVVELKGTAEVRLAEMLYSCNICEFTVHYPSVNKRSADANGPIRSENV